MAKALKYSLGYIKEASIGETIEGANMYPGYPPPSGTPNKVQYISGLLGSDGLNSGITNQAVNGSIIPQTFYINANSSYDIHILKICIEITGVSCSHSRFGSISEASIVNGWQLKLTENSNITYVANNLKTTGQMLVQFGANEVFGNSNTVNIIPNYSSNFDGVIIPVDFSRYIPYGLRIGRGNLDKLESIVRDNLTGIQSFRVGIFGFKNIPE